MKKLLAASSALALMALWSVPGSAQTATPKDDTAGLQEIVVTAQRRAESLQKAAVPVSALTAEDFEKTGVTSTDNLSRLAPSLVVQPTGGGGGSFFLRGVGSLSANAFAENAIAMNFNGVYIARPSIPTGAFYDVERVEVVKGPQGILYGRNATGGAINVIPKAPRMDGTGGDVTVELGNYSLKRAQGALNVPLGTKAALRVAGQIVDRDGYLTQGYSDEEAQAARASLKVLLSESWSATIVGDYFHQGGKGTASVLVPGAFMPQAPSLSSRISGADPISIAALRAFAAANPGVGGPVLAGLVVPPQTDGRVDSENYGVAGTIEGDLGFGTLTVISAYRKAAPDFLTYQAGFRGQIDEDNEQYSVEARLVSSGSGPLQYVVGLFYFDESQQALNFFTQGPISSTRFTPNLETQSRAVFGQLTYSVTDTVRVVGGLRYTEEEKSQSTALAVGSPTNLNPPLGAPFSGDLSFEATNWKAGLEWDAAEDTLVYANVATGFKAGGFFVAAPPQNTFQPEELTAYTVGAKSRFLNNRIQVNLEGFWWDYKDQQISFVGGIRGPTGAIGSGAITVNAGQATMYGFDADVRMKPVDDGLLSLSVQYLNGEYDSLRFTALSAGGTPIRSGCTASNSRLANPGTPNPARLFDIDCTGKRTLNSPRWSANIGYEHTFALTGDLDVVAGVATRLETSRELTIDFMPETRQSAYMMTDLFLTLESADGGWSVTAFVNNLEDEVVKAGGILRPVVPVGYVTLRPPRTYGVRAQYTF